MSNPLPAVSGSGDPNLRYYGVPGQSYTDVGSGTNWVFPAGRQPGTTGWIIEGDNPLNLPFSSFEDAVIGESPDTLLSPFLAHAQSVFGDSQKYIFGREYLNRVVEKLMEGPTAVLKVGFSGDSTTAGDGIVDPTNKINELFKRLLSYYFGNPGDVQNLGHSGGTTTDWLNNYLPGDIALNLDLYVWRWGMNDFGVAQAGGTMTREEVAKQIGSNLRAGLTLYREAHSQGVSSVVIMSPLGMSDPAHWRDAEASELINLELRLIAREFQCAFIDTYAWMRDVYNADSWMDTPFLTPVSAGSFIPGTPYTITSVGTTNWVQIGAMFGQVGEQFTATGAGSGTGVANDTSHVHPDDKGNILIASFIFDSIVPVALRKKYGTSTFINNIGIASSDLTSSSFNYGESLFRAFGSNWPLDGMAHTLRNATTCSAQWNYAYQSGGASWRSGSDSGFFAWQAVPRNFPESEYTITASSLGPTLRAGIITTRTPSGGGFPYDGSVVTIPQAGGVWIQINARFNGPEIAFRTGQASAWNSWMYLSQDLTPSGQVAFSTVAVAIATPSSVLNAPTGFKRLFFDSTNGDVLSSKDSSGVVTAV